MKSNVATSTIVRIFSVLIGSLMLAAGAVVIAAALGAFGSDGANEAPRTNNPIFALIVGAVFSFAGAGVITHTFVRKFAAACGLCAMAIFVAGINWGAFGTEELKFTKRINSAAPALSSTGRTAIEASEGRMVFGIVAIGLDALVLAGLIYNFRANVNRGIRRKQPPKNSSR